MLNTKDLSPIVLTGTVTQKQSNKRLVFKLTITFLRNNYWFPRKAALIVFHARLMHLYFMKCKLIIFYINSMQKVVKYKLRTN